jgi:hypothetical protein
MKVRCGHCGRVRSVTLLVLVLVAVALALSSSVLAQRDRRAGPSQHWRGDISRFHEHDRNVWRGGHWSHSRHDGRLGWWWGAGGLWYWYPAPVYPYPDPWVPPLALSGPVESVVPVSPPAQYWYFCEASRTYYPYVATCLGGWKPVPATPSDASPVPLQ